MIDVKRHDLVIVGGGAAGLRAAIAAVEADPEISVGLVSKVYPMRSHTVSAEGGAAAIAREDEEFVAVGSDGQRVRLDALSRGTRDQLHFAVRAALVERILDEPAFFVWDDTFLTADPGRREALVAAAVRLAHRGWQIIYLTVDPAFTGLFEKEVGSIEGLSLSSIRLGS